MSEQTSANKVKSAKQPIRVCLLGSEGSGKTCFLAGMAVLREANRHSQLMVIPSDTVTVEYLDELARTLRHRQWPPPTNVTTVLNMRVGIDDVAVELMMVDYPGEDFREALAKLKDEEIEVLYEHYQQSEMIILLFDPDRDVRPISDPAYRELQIDRQQAHFDAIGKIWAERTDSAAPAEHSVDLAIAITKADQESSLTNRGEAKHFFRKYADPLDRKLRRQAHSVGYFPLSAVGQSEQVDEKERRVPSPELSPCGYEELFRWILQRRRAKVFWRRVRKVTPFLAVLLIAIVLIFGIHSAEQRALLEILDDSRLSRTEQLDRTQPGSHRYWPEQWPSVRQRRTEVFDAELRFQEGKLESASDEGALVEIEEHLKRLEGLRPGAIQSHIEEQKEKVRAKQEDILFRRVEDAFHRKAGDFLQLAQEYLRRYPKSSRGKDARRWIGVREDENYERMRLGVKRIRVNNKASLGQKSDGLRELVQDYRDRMEKTGEAKPMLRAAELAKQFCEVNTYTVTLRRYGGFTESKQQSLILRIDGRELHEFVAPAASKEVAWSGGPLRLQWTAGQPIHVTWRNYTRWNADVSQIEDRGPTALRILGGRQPFAPVLSNWESYVNDPFMHFEIDGISEEDWQALERYILPGDGW